MARGRAAVEEMREIVQRMAPVVRWGGGRTGARGIAAGVVRAGGAIVSALVSG